MICEKCQGSGFTRTLREGWGYYIIEQCDCHAGAQHCCDGLQEQPEWEKFPEGEG